MDVRRVTVDDAPAVAVLLGELGYPASPFDVRDRIAAHEGSEDDPAWIVTGNAPDVPLGFAAGHCFQPYELDRPVAELTALVVSSEHRREGVGAALVEVVRAWATDRGCHRLTVASALHRDDAHAFYESRGLTVRSRTFEQTL